MPTEPVSPRLGDMINPQTTQPSSIGAASPRSGSTAKRTELFNALTGLLSRECDLVDKLVFKLTEAELLATAGEARFMGLMVDEIDAVTEELGSVELARGLLVSDIAHSAGLLSDDVPLSDLIVATPAEAVGPLTALRQRLLASTSGLGAATGRARASVDSRLGELHRVLDRIEPAVRSRGGYDRWGAGTAMGTQSPSRFDHSA